MSKIEEARSISDAKEFLPIALSRLEGESIVAGCGAPPPRPPNPPPGPCRPPVPGHCTQRCRTAIAIQEGK